jgi:ubiquinone biosynthesis protein COQ4
MMNFVGTDNGSTITSGGTSGGSTRGTRSTTRSSTHGTHGTLVEVEFGEAKPPPLRERMRDAFRALRVLMKDHGRLDQVLVFAQAVNAGPLARAANSFSANREGSALLREMPRIDREHVDFDALRRMPDGTLGREYTRFLDANNIGPDAFEKLPDVSDPRMAFIMLRMRQTHDLWHVLTGYSPDVRGEILLQAFTFAQIGAPSAFFLSFFGTLRWRKLMRAGHLRDLRDAYRRGKSTKPLAMFRWENEWSTPVADLQERLNCEPVSG